MMSDLIKVVTGYLRGNVCMTLSKVYDHIVFSGRNGNIEMEHCFEIGECRYLCSSIHE